MDTLITADGSAILEHLKKGDFNPANVAYISEKNDVPNTPKDSSAIAKVQISNEYISFDLSLNSKKILVVSEVFYPD